MRRRSLVALAFGVFALSTWRDWAMLPSLIVFDLDACLWSPEMYELGTTPSAYCSKRGGVTAGRDTIRLFPGAQAVLQRLATDNAFADVQIAVASATTKPDFSAICLANFPLSGSKFATIGDLVKYRQIYPGSKALEHFPKLKEESGIAYDQMIFFDDCIYTDHCGQVASRCPGTTCVRTPNGLTEEDFEHALACFAAGKKGVV